MIHSSDVTPGWYQLRNGQVIEVLTVDDAGTVAFRENQQIGFCQLPELKQRITPEEHPELFL